jgi:hypothetical protein
MKINKITLILGLAFNKKPLIKHKKKLPFKQKAKKLLLNKYLVKEIFN